MSARISFATGEIGNGLSLGIDRETDYFRIVIGDYYVELTGDNLVVRGQRGPDVLFSVPAKAKQP